jgi:hypothetical protein
MKNFRMYMCDICGFSREKPGICPHCELPLSMYTKQEQNEYQVNMEEAMRTMSDLKWYICIGIHVMIYTNLNISSLLFSCLQTSQDRRITERN